MGFTRTHTRLRLGTENLETGKPGTRKRQSEEHSPLAKRLAAVEVAHSLNLKEAAQRSRVGHRTLRKWLADRDSDFLGLVQEETDLAAQKAYMVADKWAEEALKLDIGHLSAAQVMVGYGIAVDKFNNTTKRLQELREGFNPDVIMNFTNVNVPPPVRGEVVEGEPPKALPEGALELVEPNEVEKVGK
mgnify:FL=1